jgi:hypothetical protein
VAKIQTLRPDAKDAAELESEFQTEILDVVFKYYQFGMTAAWQAGVLTAVIADLYERE